ncbi:MAG: hypothetical protein AAF737_06035, partial [Pseudomonadota bacterium]
VRPDVSVTRERLLHLHKSSAAAFEIPTHPTPNVLFVSDLGATEATTDHSSNIAITLTDCSDFMSLKASLSDQRSRALAAVACILRNHITRAEDKLDSDSVWFLARTLAAVACDDRSALTLFESDRLDAVLAIVGNARAATLDELDETEYWM